MFAPYTYRIWSIYLPYMVDIVDLGHLRNLRSELATPIAGDAKK